jgi:hypothetical protein
VPVFDFLIPLTEGYPFNQGLNNTVFISQWGFVFSLINGLAFNFLDFFNLGLNKLQFTSAFFFFAIIVFVWLAIRIFTKYKVPYVFLLLCGILAVNMFGTALFLNPRPGYLFTIIYNNNLWSLLYIHIALTLLIFKDRSALKNIIHKDLYILAFVQFLFLFLTFNYKMNYFVASFLLTLSLIPFLTTKNIVRYIVSVFVFFVSANLISALMLDYDYFVFFKTLRKTSDAVSYMLPVQLGQVRDYFRQIIFAPFLIALMTVIFNMNRIANMFKNVSVGGGDYFKKLLDGIKKLCDRTLLETIFLASIIVCGVVVILFGNNADGGRMHIIPILLCLFTFLEYCVFCYAQIR